MVFMCQIPVYRGGESPLTMRAQCVHIRYFPDPLGNVTANRQIPVYRAVESTRCTNGFSRGEAVKNRFFGTDF